MRRQSLIYRAIRKCFDTSEESNFIIYRCFIPKISGIPGSVAASNDFGSETTRNRLGMLIVDGQMWTGLLSLEGSAAHNNTAFLRRQEHKAPDLHLLSLICSINTMCGL